MMRWAAGLVRRVCGALLLLTLTVCGAEVALRLGDLRASHPVSRRQSPLQSLIVPSWTTHQELRPAASARIALKGATKPHLLRTNSFGIRGPETEMPKPADIYRVVCLGDEQVLAAHLCEEEQFCSPLQEILQHQTRMRVEVWNCGLPGGCPLTEYLLLTHRLAPLQPDLVVVAVHEPDLADDLAYRRCTRTDRNGTPMACRHPSLGRKPRADTVTAWRQQFRLVDTSLSWAGAAWQQKTQFQSSLDDAGISADLSRLRRDRSTIDRALQPLIALTDWCRKSRTGLCLCNIGPADSSSSLAVNSEWNSALTDLAAAQHVPLVNLNFASHAEARRKLTAADHHEFAMQLARCLTEELPGPWKGPYSQPENNEVTPVSHATGHARLTNQDASIKRR